MMALGAVAKHPHLRLKLVPVGLHYFSGRAPLVAEPRSWSSAGSHAML